MSLLQRRIIDRIGFEAMARARAAMGSETLKRALRLEYLGPPGEARLYVPHYWAIYHHDGRGAVYPVKAPYLIWYKDPKDDPRLSNGYPVRVSDIRKLTRAEYEAGILENWRRFNANPAGGRFQFMIVADYSGPVGRAKTYPFFTTAMQGMLARAAQIAQQEVRAEVRSFVPVRGTRTATLSI